MEGVRLGYLGVRSVSLARYLIFYLYESGQQFVSATWENSRSKQDGTSFWNRKWCVLLEKKNTPVTMVQPFRRSSEQIDRLKHIYSLAVTAPIQDDKNTSRIKIHELWCSTTFSSFVVLWYHVGVITHVCILFYINFSKREYRLLEHRQTNKKRNSILRLTSMR